MRSAQVERPEDILAADRIVFPGVGAYEQAMGVLARRGYIDPLKEYIQAQPAPARPAAWPCIPQAPWRGHARRTACAHGTRCQDAPEACARSRSAPGRQAGEARPRLCRPGRPLAQLREAGTSAGACRQRGVECNEMVLVKLGASSGPLNRPSPPLQCDAGQGPSASRPACAAALGRLAGPTTGGGACAER
jgi:hypothetical protein